MDMYSQLQSVHSPDEGKASVLAAESAKSQTKDTLSKACLDLEPPSTAVSGDTRYLTQLWVSRDRDEVSQSEPSSQSTITCVGFEHRDHNVYPHGLKIQDKIKLALKLLHFREPRVLVQFWSPHIVGNHKVLTTIDQPFGLGVNDEGLSSYRKDSERNICVLDNNQEDLKPTARVFRQGLPEWTTDLTNYLPKYFPQQEYALQCNLHGYLALPVFNSSTRECLGVLELLTSSKYRSYAYEVRQLYIALKAADLTTTQAFDRPTLNVHNEHMNSELEKILSILRIVCENHQLPLAQTWAISPFRSFASHEQILKSSCNSFDSRCLGRTCLSTAALPFHVQDLVLWPFRKACKELHLDKSCSFVGKVLFSRGSCFCEDVTKLSEEEYPLVHYAHINGITSCFAIYLHGVESNADYVLEFFLPLNIEGRHVQNLVQTLKQHFEMASVFELGDKSPIQVVGPSREASSLFLNTDPQSTIISSTITTKTKIPEMVSSDSESFVADLAKTDSTHVLNQLSPKQEDFLDNNGGTITSSAIVIQDDVIRDDIDVVDAGNDENAASNHDVSMQIASNTVTGTRETSNRMKRGRKRKIDSLTMEAVNKHVDVGKPIDEAAKSLGVSRSTLKRFCRDHDMTSWPLPKHNKKTARVTDSKLSQKSTSIKALQGSSSVRFGFFGVVILLVRVKRWSCLSKNHGFSGKWWSCGKHSYLPFKLDSMYQVARLMLSLKRWKNKNSIRRAMQNRDHLTDSTEKPKNETNIINPGSDIKKVTVKATFKDDIIKFQLPTSSGLFELENEVAQRIKLQNKRVRLKYRDEDDDMILLACDADLHNLLGNSPSNNCIIKLSIQLVDE
ncbi:NIN-like protein [Artemisia annua]|uniref:NIN-like protein n=1 Tax=Artemisia annua TaxID=35608 RepID=A0A2U1PDS3_ARTAN|nr:NIN-like protein [Artemisia annua]